ncbi:MAG: inositol monophosphatase [Gemmatimonadetes bacterium]|nr:inositol monophosphatase [Gemmatimonadota bacterium]MBI3566736.1 inositol monophosphatase [Gemmatimonadota bacterium]
MTEQSPEALLDVAREAARLAAASIRDATPRAAGIVWQEKSATDFVSEVDLASERIIIDTVRRRVPGARMLAEETASRLDPADQARGIVFVADPLDGTTNFLHGYPEYAVSIGVLLDGALVAAVVIDVPGDEEFTATLGGGTRRDGEPVRVSTIANPQRALIGTGFPFKDATTIAPYQDQMSRVMAGVSGVRRPGAAAIDLASVACGRFDAFWENSLSPWDIAAGILLVQEAGGLVTDVAGAPCHVAHTGIVAGNPYMHAWLLRTILG